MGPDNKLGQYQYDSHLIIIELTMREKLMFEYLSLSSVNCDKAKLILQQRNVCQHVFKNMVNMLPILGSRS